MHEQIKQVTKQRVKYVVLENSQGHAILGANYWKQQGAIGAPCPGITTSGLKASILSQVLIHAAISVCGNMGNHIKQQIKRLQKKEKPFTYLL
jgi:hypothetical protein